MQDSQSDEYQTVMYFENRIDLSIDQYVTSILENLEHFTKDSFKISHHGSLLDQIRLEIVDKVEQAKYPRLNINHSLCNLCGICVKGCPEQNLKKTTEKISIRDEKKCLHCLRCLHRCPQYAISFGELTTGPQRYTPEIQNKLYQKATATPINALEPSSKKIRRIWALNSIKYWLFH